MKKYITTLCLIVNLVLFAQNPEIKSDLPTVIPPSPTVAALMKFEETPVSNYTGLPDVSIPLFSTATHSKDVGINIAIKYHAGVGANDRASDVGLGWSLFAGGSISRTVRGLPDEELVMDTGDSNPGKVGLYHTSIANHNNYYYQHGDNFSQFVYNQPYQANEYLWDIVERGKFDTEHDLWQFNFMGNSGRFYIKKNMQTNQLEVKPLDDYRVTIINTYATIGNNNYIPTGFTIYDEKGYKYVFDIVETTINKTAVTNSFVESTSTSTSADKEFKSAFHLSKVYDTNNNLLVEFLFNNNPDFKEHTVNSTITVNDYFSSLTNSHSNAIQLMKMYNCFGEFKPLKSVLNSYSNVSVKKIQTINVVGFSKIDFNYVQGRLDTNLLNPDKATFIDKITIKNWNNEIVKKFQFDYDYSLVIENRMILKKIKEIDVNVNSNNQYEFFYEQNDLSGYNPSKDYWGYFNLTPTCYNIDLAFSNEPTPTFSSTDVLQKIKYPTGGCVIFDFEANRYSYTGNVAITNFEENANNFHLNNTSTLTFSNSLLKLLPVSTTENRKVKFYPSIVLDEDPNLNTRTFTLLEKVNGSWVSRGSLSCSVNNSGCCIDYVLNKDKEYAIRRDNFDINYSGTDILIIEYFAKNTTELKFLYGGGNRIKQIGYFDKDAPQEYYTNPSNFPQFIPSKEKKFVYTLPTDTNKSSGALVFAKPLFKYESSIKINTMCPEPPFYSPSVGYADVIGFVTNTNFNNLNALKTQGSDVGYKYVSVVETGNGFIDYEYTSPIDFSEDIWFSTTPPFLPSKNYDYKRGLLLKEVIKNQSSLKLQEVNHVYGFDSFEVKYGVRRYKPSGTCFGGSYFSSYLSYLPFWENYQGLPIQNQGGTNAFSGSNLCGYPANYSQSYDLVEAYGWAKLTSKNTKNYFYPNGGTAPNIVESNETFTYNLLNKQIASHAVDNSLGDILTTNYFYHTGNSPFTQNRIAEIERIETKRGTDLLSESKINYSNAFVNNQSYLAQSVEVKKGSSATEVRLKNNIYDEFGHVLEVQQENGIKISYIYGYNKTQLVAKIENIAYSAIPANLIADIQSASNGTNEQALLNAFTALRNATALNDTMITTITYKPLIGVSTMTDPKGDKMTYHYDSFNRLEFVKDKNGNILSENQYHYKN
ncbi:MAG: hypothetical protein V4666_04160 [Bacteroidota bacterium]